MNKKFILVIAGVIAIAGVVFVATNKNNGVPCSSRILYCIQSDSNGKVYPVNGPSEYSFSILNDRVSTIKDFAITHTKPMHVIVVRKDLAYFQHVHPEFDRSTGVFTLKNITFPADGVYRIFADFATPMPVTVYEDVSVGVGAKYTAQVLGSETRIKIFDGYQISLSPDQPLVSGKEVMLMFDLNRNGAPVTNLQNYLGALGHSVILREGTLDFIHAHPMEDHGEQTGEMGFMVEFPEAGKYKVFMQFQHESKIITSNFVVNVAKGSGMPMPKMDHSMD